MIRVFAVLLLVGAAIPAYAADVAGVKVPPYERVVLPNGATFLLMPQHDVPLIAFDAVLRGGAAVDPPQRSGTASLLANLLLKGAGERDAFKFADTVDEVGGSIDVEAEHEYIGVSGSFLARDRELMVRLLGDLLQRPRLDATEFETLRARHVELIRAAKDSALESLVSVYGTAALLPLHPYGRPVDGSEGSLGRIRLEDVRTLYAQHAGADRLIVSIAGDFEPRAMKQLLIRTFSGWRRAGVPLPRIEEPTAPAARRVLLIDAPDSAQSYFWIGGLGVAKNDPRRAAIDVANTLFGGRFTSMLNSELRIHSGLTYGARSRFERFAHRGFWSMTSYTQTATTADTIERAVSVLTRLHTAGLPADALASGREYVKGQFPLALETAEQWSGLLGQMELYGLGRGYVDDYLPAVARTDAKAVQQVIDEVFPTAEHVQVVVIGPAAKIRDDLRKYGALTEMRLTDPEFVPTAAP